ncbi:uncharacterized protein JCM10292_003656 [Rhodotorula paludigena]|uniref:uncharacterized protein n=1 Tax=Rhodotorula paludigena TaxID=86838 RepID=UPI00317E5068
MKTSSDDAGGERVTLELRHGPLSLRITPLAVIHTVFLVLAQLLRLPKHLIKHYILFRRSSALVQDLGRHVASEIATTFVRALFLDSYLAVGRPIFAKADKHTWVTPVEVAGVQARWIAPPDGRRREDDELVLFWIHGGGFVVDVGGTFQPALVELAQTICNRGVRFSIFHLHYRLAPEYIYPSQLIETLAGYHHLVNELGISPSKICVGGDSAGGNLATAFLLHLARPNPKIRVPKKLGPTPGKPGSALLVSPFVNLVSYAPSRRSAVHLDLLHDGGVFNAALHYVGAVAPLPSELTSKGWRAGPSWSPLQWFSGRPSCDSPPEGIVDLSASVEEAEREQRGLKLLASPYVNPHPGVVKDLEWYKEALPGDSKTLVTWGGKEIFADDILDFVQALQKAGVAPAELVKPLGIHDWVLQDAVVPQAAVVKNGGEQSERDYGVRKLADWFEARARELKAE